MLYGQVQLGAHVHFGKGVVDMKRHLCPMLGLALIFALSAYAQQGSTGSIAGTVADPSGQVVPGATVKLTFELNGEERTTTSNEGGDFFFGALTPGAYTVRIDAAGFRPI